MRYSLNIYDENSEIENTVETDFVPVGLFIRALEMSERMKKESMSELDQFNLMIDIVLMVFRKLDRQTLIDKCDINDVMNIFKQIVNRANTIKSSKN